MTEDRSRRLEVLSQISIELHRLSEESTRQIAARQVRMEEQAEERQRESEEYYRQMDENLGQMRELIGRMAQTMALIQADVVRLDESR